MRKREGESRGVVIVRTGTTGEVRSWRASGARDSRRTEWVFSKKNLSSWGEGVCARKRTGKALSLETSVGGGGGHTAGRTLLTHGNEATCYPRSGE